jgi:phosphatidylserine decarboxylase
VRAARHPFVRVGLAELLLIGGLFLLLAILLAWLWWPAALGPAVLLGLVVWFFRDPPRTIPSETGMVVAPADGKVVLIERVDDPQIGPAVQFGIFLSIFNVHANRAAAAGRVLGLRYRPGKFMNALRVESARENEQLEITMEGETAPYRLMKIRQITGQFARRIVCWVRPGDRLGRGEMFGMIKLGSRTELLIPDEPGLEILTRVGDKIQAGASRMARYPETSPAAAGGGKASPEPPSNAPATGDAPPADQRPT